MISNIFMNTAKVSYFGAGTASVLSNFGQLDCGAAGAVLFIIGTMAVLASSYKRIEERYQRRMASAMTSGQLPCLR